jgi:hypothetical protein
VGRFVGGSELCCCIKLSQRTVLLVNSSVAVAAAARVFSMVTNSGCVIVTPCQAVAPLLNSVSDENRSDTFSRNGRLHRFWRVLVSLKRLDSHHSIDCRIHPLITTHMTIRHDALDQERRLARLLDGCANFVSSHWKCFGRFSQTPSTRWS